MATKKKDKAAEANAAAKAETKKGGKKELTAEETQEPGTGSATEQQTVRHHRPGRRQRCKDLRYERPEVRSPHHLGRNRQGWQSDCHLECHHSGGIG